MPYDDDDVDYEPEYEEDEDEDRESNLLGYDFAPYPTLFVTKDGEKTQTAGKALWLGMEIEVRSQAWYRWSDVESLSRFSDNIFMKHDGSLHERDGFEIVTRPMHPDYMRSFVPKLSELLQNLSIMGHSAGEGYGMHVHVSRAAFTPLHLAKLIVFMSDENRELLVNVAQRDNAEWCEIKTKRMRSEDVCNPDGDKYQALATFRERTIEYRIFRSNTQANRILKNIEFVLATVEYTRNCGIRELTTDSFLKWLKNHRKEYLNLYKFLAEKEKDSNYTGRYADVLNHRRAKRAANA